MQVEYKNQYVLPTLKYLYGPMNNRLMGNPQRNFNVEIDWSHASLQNGWVLLPYRYSAVWIINRDLVATNKITVPVPYTAAGLETQKWLRCTDPEPEHQNMELFWYFWDPTRVGCDHKEGSEYQNILIVLKQKTRNQTATYPEYENLFQKRAQGQAFTMTFAFGYTESNPNPQPDQDTDFGIRQYQDFVSYVKKKCSPSSKKKVPSIKVNIQVQPILRK